MLTPERVEEWAVLGGASSTRERKSEYNDKNAYADEDADEDADEAASESESENQNQKTKREELVVGKDKFPDEFVLGLNQTWKF